jgi:hypothetical protein
MIARTKTGELNLQSSVLGILKLEQATLSSFT